MPLAPFAWFLLAATALQAVVGLRLALERAPWVRVAAALFLLNALLTPTSVLQLAGGLELALILVDGPTGSLLVVLAVLVPAPRRGAAAVGVAVATWSLGCLAALAIGLPIETFRLLYQGVPVMVGFAAFVLLVAVPHTRSLRSAPAWTGWLVAAVGMRAVEFAARYGLRLRPAADPAAALYWGSAIALLLAVGAWIALLALADRRSPAFPIVAAAIGGGLALGLLDLLPSLHATAESEVLRRFSLVVSRPVLVAIAALGVARARTLLAPFGAAVVAGAASQSALAPLLSSAAADVLVQAFAAAAALLAAAATAALLRARDRAVAPVAAAERRAALLAHLAGSSRATDDEKHSRGALAAGVGIEPRNFHRFVLDTNAAAGRPVVAWRIGRGAANQRTYFYHLTEEGRGWDPLADERNAALERGPSPSEAKRR